MQPYTLERDIKTQTEWYIASLRSFRGCVQPSRAHIESPKFQLVSCSTTESNRPAIYCIDISAAYRHHKDARLFELLTESEPRTHTNWKGETIAADWPAGREDSFQLIAIHRFSSLFGIISGGVPDPSVNRHSDSTISGPFETPVKIAVFAYSVH